MFKAEQGRRKNVLCVGPSGLCSHDKYVEAVQLLLAHTTRTPPATRSSHCFAKNAKKYYLRSQLAAAGERTLHISQRASDGIRWAERNDCSVKVSPVSKKNKKPTKPRNFERFSSHIFFHAHPALPALAERSTPRPVHTSKGRDG